MDAPDQHDLEQLRSFRTADAVPPVGLLERLEEDLARTIELDVAASAAPPARSTRRPRQPWYARLVRPALVGAATAVLAVGVGSFGAFGDDQAAPPTAATATTQAGTSLLEGAASTLFGASQAGTAPVVGMIDGTEDVGRAREVIADPQPLGSDHVDVLERLPRDPARLRDLMRSAADELDRAGDPGDRLAFLLTMRLVVDDQLPLELRAALLRSLDGIDGMDRAVPAADSLGRRGILLSHFDTATGVRDQLLLEADGATTLERRSFTTAYVDPACPPGTFTSYQLFDEDGAPLEPAQVPMLDWPDLVPSCGGSGADLA